MSEPETLLDVDASPGDWTEAMLCAAIAKTWPSHGDRPRYVTAFQVLNGSGFAWSRKLDAVVLDTWRSGGFRLAGYEVKISAGDLRRELQDTTKFADFAPYLDTFSIVAPAGVAKMDLLPPQWGLYCPQADGTLRAKRKPLMLHDGRQTDVMTRDFAASFCRALVDRDLDRERMTAEYDRGFKSGRHDVEHERHNVEHRLESLRTTVDAFESASGVKLDSYRGKSIGEAVKLVLDGGLNLRARNAGDLHALAGRLETLACDLDAIALQLQTEPEDDGAELEAALVRSGFIDRP